MKFNFFYDHMRPGAREYRHRYTKVWAGHPQLKLEPCIDLTLPPLKAQRFVGQELIEWGQKDPPFIDFICTAFGKGEHYVLLLWPPWSGKTIVTATTLGLQLPSFHKEMDREELEEFLATKPNLLSLQPSSYRLFNSDMAWAMPYQGKLALLRPRGELAIWLWDLARTITREALGRKRFEEDRESHPKPEDRAQFQVFQKLDPQPLRSLIAREWRCHPNVLVFLERQARARKKVKMEKIKERGWKGLVRETLEKAAVFTGRFWARDEKKVARRIGALVGALGGSNRPRLVRVVVGRGKLPIKEVACLIQQLLEEA